MSRARDLKSQGTVRQAWEMELVLAARTGASVRALGRMFKVSRNTVRRVLRDHQIERGEAPELRGPGLPPRSSKLDPYLPQLRGLLEKFPRLSAVRLHEEIQKEGYAGGTSILRERLRQGLRPVPRKEGVQRFETGPGQQGQMDWSPYTLYFEDGRKETVLCFSYILGYSRRQYIDFTLRRDFHTLIRRHRDAFEYFGGVPRHCLYDGEKTVLLRWEGITSPAHHAVKSERYGLLPVRDSFLGLGPSAAAFLEGLTRKNRHHAGYHARAILSQKETYHSDDIHNALTRAVAYGAFESKAVERILLAKAHPRTLESLRDEAALRRLQESLPTIHQRPLDEYSLERLTKEKEDDDEKSPPRPGE